MSLCTSKDRDGMRLCVVERHHVNFLLLLMLDVPFIHTTRYRQEFKNALQSNQNFEYIYWLQVMSIVAVSHCSHFYIIIIIIIIIPSPPSLLGSGLGCLRLCHAYSRTMSSRTSHRIDWHRHLSLLWLHPADHLWTRSTLAQISTWILGCLYLIQRHVQLHTLRHDQSW